MHPKQALAAITLALSLFCIAAAPALARSADKTAATATCEDGTTSKGGKGACSHHGGVAKESAQDSREARKADRAEKRADRAKARESRHSESEAATMEESTTNDPADATARCKDGTYSHARQHSGACSHHGGVDKFLK